MNPREIRRYLLDVHNHKRVRPLLEAGAISYANWWKEDPEQAWFTRFIRHHFPQYVAGKDSRLGAGLRPIRFYSVFGPRSVLQESFDGVKIFFTGENLEDYRRDGLVRSEGAVRALDTRRSWYADYGSGDVQISMGFAADRETPVPAGDTPASGPDRQDGRGIPPTQEDDSLSGHSAGYLRFPLWILRYFEPEDGPEEIRTRVRAINEAGERRCAEDGALLRTHGIACISSHDMFGTKAAVCDRLEAAGLEIQYPGRWRHNTDTLKTQFDDDKDAYLRSVRFNVCPENSDTKDYVTEKLFDAFAAGVLPIYLGSQNDPEPGLINREAVIFWDCGGDNAEAIDMIRKLEEDDAACAAFLEQPKLTPATADYVADRMCKLRTLLERELER